MPLSVPSDQPAVLTVMANRNVVPAVVPWYTSTWSPLAARSKPAPERTTVPVDAYAAAVCPL